MTTNHTHAVEVAIKAAEGNLTAAHGPLLELVRALAKQMDATGTEGPGSRLAASYLSALKDFSRVSGSVTSGVDAIDELKARRRRRMLSA